MSNAGTSIGKVQWQSPSNIALIKYWGKKGFQLPANPSLSLTLSESCTNMELTWQPKADSGIELDFFFEGQPNNKFADKIRLYLERWSISRPWLEDYSLSIRSSNTFPHSTGIASSASSMGALALCLCSMERVTQEDLTDDEAFFEMASDMARQASGSASRSVYGGVTVWGETPAVEGSSDHYAIPVTENIDPYFLDYNDAVLIVSGSEKAVSSRAGHALMDDNPYATARYQHANNNLAALYQAMQTGDVEAFNFIVENEALALHALMMVSNPSVVLFKPNTWEIINRLRTFRGETGYNVCFTLDAGPNVHVLYPEEAKSAVEQLINEELVVYCEQNRWIPDKVGSGPEKVNHE